MRAFQMTNFENKNCSELLLTNGMGLDGAPVKFLTLVFLRRPTAQYITVSMGSTYIQGVFFHWASPRKVKVWKTEVR